MRHDPWHIWPERGFLMNPDPIARLREAASSLPIALSDLTHAQTLAADLPDLLRTRRVRTALAELPVVDLWPLNAHLDQLDFRLVERLMQMYAYFASAYVYATHELPAGRIPEGVALPLVQLAALVERPPILTYANYVLNNWERIDPNGPITVENTRIIQDFLGTPSESWFVRIHVAIEARAAAALAAVQQGMSAAEQDDLPGLEAALADVHAGVCALIETFGRMPEGCDAETYSSQLRPYLFGFQGVIYEGAFGNQPQDVRGQTATQSAIIPALSAALGLPHESSRLTQPVEIMQAYRPRPHREFVAALHESGIRAAVLRHPERGALAESYNECLRRLFEFRRAHYHFTTPGSDKVASALDADESDGADWLQQLSDETAQQLV